MPIAFDTAGLRPVDQHSWQVGDSADLVISTYSDLVPDLPAPLSDQAGLRRALAATCAAEGGGLVEAWVFTVDSVRALFQIVKMPHPGRPTGMVFVGSFTLAKARCSAVLSMRAAEGPGTGTREAAVVAQLGPAACFPAHPYAPELRANAADDPRWDPHFPDHPLSRIRAWAHHTVATARVDPRFACLPDFVPVDAAPTVGIDHPAAPDAAPMPSVEAGDVLETAAIGLPVGGYLPLWHQGQVSYWRLADPAPVLGRLGMGTVSRAEIDTRRYREIALLAAGRATMMLTARYPSADGEIVAESHDLVPATAEEAHAAATDEALTDLYRWIGDRVHAAATRGEFVAVETGGWTVPVEPCVLMLVRPSGDTLLSVVEATPVPVGAAIWADRQPVVGNGQTLVSPANDATLRVAGHLTRFAVQAWGVHPFGLGLSFGPNPTLATLPTR
ncbi:hypothetical protein [Actinokineospora sp.]|uniref:hypothetical protein n=1 Tax=Actinokineospora sp. TaxID=1872133 RepID=UPI00403812C7